MTLTILLLLGALPVLMIAIAILLSHLPDEAADMAEIRRIKARQKRREEAGQM